MHTCTTEQHLKLKYNNEEKEYLYEIKAHPLDDKKQTETETETETETLYIINDITEQQKNQRKQEEARGRFSCFLFF